jgi:hypothetical protein
MRVKVTHSIDDLANDALSIATKTRASMAMVVKRDTIEGRKLAQSAARAKSGPHGRNYYKRITDEMLSPLVGEFGPHGDVVGNAVGAEWRGAPANNDLPQTADVIGPKFARDIADAADGLFW